jgi:hypothetical protein
MRWLARRALVFLSITAVIAGAQSLSENPGSGTWVDQSTGLMWAGKDNGKDVNWGQAAKYAVGWVLGLEASDGR